MRSLREWRLINEFAADPQATEEGITADEAQVDQPFHANLKSGIKKYLGYLLDELQGQQMNFNQKAFVAQEILRELQFTPASLARAINKIKQEMKKAAGPHPASSPATPATTATSVPGTTPTAPNA